MGGAATEDLAPLDVVGVERYVGHDRVAPELVSCPPTMRLPTIVTTSSCVRRSPASSASSSPLIRSSPRSARRESIIASTSTIRSTTETLGHGDLVGIHEAEEGAPPPAVISFVIRSSASDAASVDPPVPDALEVRARGTES
jgi:hypothetical protein